MRAGRATNPDLGPVRGLTGLKFVAYGMSPQPPFLPTRTAAQFWADYDQNGWLRRLRAAGVEVRELRRNADGTWHLNVTGSTLADLAVLAGAPLGSLDISNTKVSDLTPLRGMPLTALWLYGTPVTDLTPLKGLKLTLLNVSGCPVRDSGPLRGMPLDNLHLTNCAELVDVSPLASLKETLRELTLPPNAAGYEFLRSFPKLERLGFEEDSTHEYRPNKTAAEFWAWHDDPSRVADKP
jgi:hypothetical protein